MTGVEPYDHYRAGPDAPVPPGVYRVVGLDGEAVVLLRVTDGSGRRINAGTVERHDRGSLPAAFEPAEDPDAGASLSDLVDPFTALLSALRYRLGL